MRIENYTDNNRQNLIIATCEEILANAITGTAISYADTNGIKTLKEKRQLKNFLAAATDFFENLSSIIYHIDQSSKKEYIIINRRTYFFEEHHLQQDFIAITGNSIASIIEEVAREMSGKKAIGRTAKPESLKNII